MRREPVTLTYDGVDYEVVPNMDALAAVEDTGLYPIQLLGEIEVGRARVTDVATVIAAVLRAKGKRVSRNEVGQTLLDTKLGYANACTFIGEFLAGAFSAGPDKPLPDPGEDGESGKPERSA